MSNMSKIVKNCKNDKNAKTIKNIKQPFTFMKKTPNIRNYKKNIHV